MVKREIKSLCLLHHPSLALRKIALFIFLHHLPATSQFSLLRPWALVCPQTVASKLCVFLLRRRGFDWRCTLSNCFIYSTLHLEGFSDSDWERNGSSLWLRSGGVVCDGRCQHQRGPIHVVVYHLVPGTQRAATKERSESSHGRMWTEDGGVASKWREAGEEVWIFRFYPAH